MRTVMVPTLVAAAVLVFVQPAVAGSAEQDAVRTACEADTNLPPGICDCLAGKAAEMSEGQQSLLAATANGNDAAAAQLRAQLPPDQVMEVAMFYVNQPRICAGG